MFSLAKGAKETRYNTVSVLPIQIPPCSTQVALSSRMMCCTYNLNCRQ